MGIDVFVKLKRYGLTEDALSVDYGCGTLRVGQHVIRFLPAGGYVGLDISTYLLDQGCSLLAPSLVDELHGYLREEGRDPAAFPLHATMSLSPDLDALTERCIAFRDAGFTRLGMHIPSVDPAAKIGVDEYLKQLEAVHRDVWPAVTGGRNDRDRLPQ